MRIRDFLSASEVAIDIRASDKLGLLKELAGRAASALNLSPDAVSNEIVKRDDLGSTGIGRGASIPHARLREVKKPFGILARLKNPIEFNAIDGQWWTWCSSYCYRRLRSSTNSMRWRKSHAS